MSYIETSFVGVAKIRVQEPDTRRNGNGNLFTTQRLTFIMDDGDKQEITLHLSTGAHALMLGPVVSNEEAPE